MDTSILQMPRQREDLHNPSSIAKLFFDRKYEKKIQQLAVRKKQWRL